MQLAFPDFSGSLRFHPVCALLEQVGSGLGEGMLPRDAVARRHYPELVYYRGAPLLIGGGHR